MSYSPKRADGTDTWGNLDQPIEWFRGDRIQATGGAVTLHGALWSVWRYIEGHKKGKECLRPFYWPESNRTQPCPAAPPLSSGR